MEEISIVPGEKIDYSKHIGLANTSLPKIIDSTEENVVSLLREVYKSLRISNYTVFYSYSTASTTKQITDLYTEHGAYAISLYIDAEGGGFDIQINDSPDIIKGLKGTVIQDEIIHKISIIGYGNAGKSKIRLNLVK